MFFDAFLSAAFTDEPHNNDKNNSMKKKDRTITKLGNACISCNVTLFINKGSQSVNIPDHLAGPDTVGRGDNALFFHKINDARCPVVTDP